MITFRQKGDFSKLNNYLEKIKDLVNLSDLDRYGKEGVAALSSATPVDSGKTAASWSYNIIRGKNRVVLQFHNSNIQDGVPIAVILQYGHGTRNGGYVQGIDYINPAIRPIFKKIADDAWKGVTEH